MVCCLLYTPVFTHAEHCCFPACVYIVCPLCMCMSGLWTESSRSTGATLYPWLILIYVKAMAHWGVCTMDWSASGMCQRPLCVRVCVCEMRETVAEVWTCVNGPPAHCSLRTWHFQYTHTRTPVGLEVWHICMWLSTVAEPCSSSLCEKLHSSHSVTQSPNMFVISSIWANRSLYSDHLQAGL